MKYTNRSLRQRKGDKWEVVFTYVDPVSQTNKPVYRTVTAKTRKAAEKARDDLRFALESESDVQLSKTSVASYTADFIERKRKSGTVERSTIAGYKTESKIMTKYISDKPIEELRIADVDNLIAQMISDGYTPCTCGKIFRLLKMTLKDAMAHDLITKNPCDYTRPPRRPKQEIRALSKSERTRMLSLVRKVDLNPLSLAIELALATGMRRGELCALRWSDLNESGVIHVRRALGADSGAFYEKETKTTSSTREIPLAKPTLDVLVNYKEELSIRANELQVPFDDPYILCKTGLGTKPYNPTLLTREFTTFAKMNGFNCTFHDLRHTFATYMVTSGVDISTVASYLGHSNVAVTLNTYATVDPDAKRAALATIEQAIGYAS
ncbi:tyrosine-type recombinase/integrase [Eggerthella guodeyinii]|uniref:Tyrosine-type recombinase/integrase n=1 Tax=Eggerthella guodeyinii TaxID=2690837 RepID=A0A6N7RKI4_9ACTN|nr:site-specific integrase [Eggerthella guodeyinii]MRX81736.1 tyrosine-type recombinase/integrase [Eggerthella guodeyinii]